MEYDAPQFSIIVCSLNGEKVLPVCLSSLAKLEAMPAHEVIAVDNGSRDATAEIVRGFKWIRLLQTGRNLGFAGGNNVGIKAAKGEFIVLLNDDTEVPPDWLRKLIVGFERGPKIGAVGCKLLYPDRKTIQHAGCVVHANGNTDHLGYGEEDRGQWDAPGERMYVTGAAVALRREALQECGLLDPGFFPIYFEEVDLQKRMRDRGWKIWYEPAAWLVHYESQSQVKASPRFVYRYTKNRMRYLALHGMPEGAWKMLREEWRFFSLMARAGHGWTMLKAYAVGKLMYLPWRLDRKRRRSVEWLDR